MTSFVMLFDVQLRASPTCYRLATYFGWPIPLMCRFSKATGGNTAWCRRNAH